MRRLLPGLVALVAACGPAELPGGTPPWVVFHRVGPAIDLVDTDTGCTGDEAVVDTTCGGNQAGELGRVLFSYASRIDCTSGSGTSLFGNSLVAPTPMSLGTLEPGAILCGRVEIGYPMNRSADDVQRSQSDTSTWKWAFDGTTAA